MEVRITKRASKELNKIPNTFAKKILEQLLDLEENPFPINSKKLSGQENYRIRVGMYRAIYFIDRTKKQIRILRIRHRKDVYR